MTDSRSTQARAQDREWAELVAKIQAGTWLPFERQLDAFQKNLSSRKIEDGPPLVWVPDKEVLAQANLTSLAEDLGLQSFNELHRWSVQQREAFWRAVISRLSIVFQHPPSRILDLENGPADPKWLPDARLNCVDSCFQAPKDNIAIVSASESRAEICTTTYGELEELVNRVTAGLSQLGFRAGDAIALYMPMTVECVAAYLGVVRAGCAVVSIADSFSAGELAHRLEISGAVGVITVDGYQRGGRWIDLYSKVKEAEAPHTVVIATQPETAFKLRSGDSEWTDMLSRGGEPASVAGRSDDVTNILFSSGTTATPKAIPWTHLTPIKAAMDGHFHHDINEGDVVAWPTNIGWMMGPWLIYASLVNRATMALFEGAPNSKEFVSFVAYAGVSMLGVVPSLVKSWRGTGAVPQDLWKNVRVLSSTGEPSNREDYLWLMSRTHYRAPVIEYCGGTEIGGGYITGSVVQPASPATFTTPALGLDVVLLDEDGNATPVGRAGEVFLIPPSIGLSQRLLNRDHDEVYYQGCPSGAGGEKLRRHGDQLARIGNGFWAARGRADDTMNLGGIKVGSLELEQVIDQHRSIHKCAAVGVQAEGEGIEALVVYVVSEDVEINEDDLRAELNELIAKKMNPLFKIDSLVVVDELPRTASNKLIRRALRQER